MAGTGSKYTTGTKIIAWFLALMFGVSGAGKLLGVAGIAEQFVEWGYPTSFLYLIGFGEIVGATLLLRRKTAVTGCGALLIILGGAAATHLSHGDYLLALIPLGMMGLLLKLAWEVNTPESIRRVSHARRLTWGEVLSADVTPQNLQHLMSKDLFEKIVAEDPMLTDELSDELNVLATEEISRHSWEKLERGNINIAQLQELLEKEIKLIDSRATVIKPSFFSRLFSRSMKVPLQQGQREAIVDVLVYAMLVDRDAAPEEVVELKRHIKRLTWESSTPMATYVSQSIERVTALLDEDESAKKYCSDIAERLKEARLKEKVYMACLGIIQADGKIAEEESVFRDELAAAFSFNAEKTGSLQQLVQNMLGSSGTVAQV